MGKELVPGAKVYMLEETNLRPWTITGRGATAAECIAMAKAIANASIGTVDAAYQAVALTGADLATPTGSGPFTDVLFTLVKGTAKRTLRINNFDLALTTSGGGVTTANQKVIDIVSAYRDEDGQGGYSLKSAVVVA